jgi:hypothetical protein
VHANALRVLRFRGRIGGQSSALADAGRHAGAGLLMSWTGAAPRIRYDLHLQASVYEIHLDALLPRVCELAADSPVRAIKVAACEFLHACKACASDLGGTRRFNQVSHPLSKCRKA